MKQVISASHQSVNGRYAGKKAILTFRLEGQTYGLPITAVNQIIELVAITRIPQVPPGVQGVINVHGSIVPVIDLRQRFNLQSVPYHLHTPLVLVDVGDSALALVVDEVKEVVEMEQTTMPDPDAADLIIGTVNVDRQLVPLVNVKQILSSEEQKQLCQVLAASPLIRRESPGLTNGRMGDLNP